MELKLLTLPLSKPSLRGCDGPQPSGVGVAVLVGVLVGGLVTVGVGETGAVKVGRGVFVTVAVGGVPVTVGVGVPPNGALGSGHTKAPRERVKAARVVKPRSIEKSHTMTLGMPVLKRNEVGEATSMSLV